MNRCYLRPAGGVWQVVPHAIEATAEIDLPEADTVEAADRQWANYAAHLMNITGPYNVEFRSEEEGAEPVVLAAFSAAVARGPGDPIVSLPGGMHMVAQYIAPDVKDTG